MLAEGAGARPAAAAPVPANGRRVGQRFGGTGQRFGGTRQRGQAGGAGGCAGGADGPQCGDTGGAVSGLSPGGGAIWLSRAAAAAGRGALRLVPAGRRDWAEAIWAEAYEVPSGFRRLAWRAGGVRVIAREALMARKIGRWLLFAVAVALATWANWPGPPGRFATAIARMDVVTTVLLLAGLPLLARCFLGPAINSRLARFLRAGGYAAILALMVAKASVLRGVPAETGPALQFDWFAQIVFLVVMAGYVAAILAMTAPRSRVAPATLAAGTGAGIALGVVMYAVAPLGLTNDATEPWLPGAAIDPVVVLAWILLLGGPVVAGAVAVLRYRGPGSPQQVTDVRIWQGGAAGFLATGIGGLMVTVLGTGTVALMPRAAWLRNLLYPSQHLLPAVAYSREFAASERVGGYGLILLAFPVIGLVMGLFGVAIGDSATSSGSSPGGGGPPGPEPVPDPPDRGLAADAGVSTDELRGDLPGWNEEGPDNEHGEVTAGVAGVLT